MKRYFLFLLIGFMAFSCKDKADNVTPPAEVLGKEQMVNILTEMHIAEAKTSSARLSADSSRILFIQLQDEIMKKYDTDTATYKASYSWYAEHVKLMDEVYAAVVDSLGARESTNRIESNNNGKASQK